MIFTPSGVCSKQIEFDIVEKDGDKIVTGVKFTGGCNGNTQGICKLVEGMKAEDVIARIEGIKCGMKSTSCPDQLAKALRQAMN